jgi:hypothetical protein
MNDLLKTLYPTETVLRELCGMDGLLPPSDRVRFRNILYAKKGKYKVGDVIDHNGRKEVLKKFSSDYIGLVYFDIWETKEISKLEYEMRKIIEENKK